MRITSEQKAVLDTFTCQRLREDPANSGLIRDFVCAKAPALAAMPAMRGWSSDVKGTIAYYVVKDAAGRIVMYFSLRCGLLCEPGYVRRVMRLLDETELLRNALEGSARGDAYWKDILDREKERLGPAKFENRVWKLRDLHSKKVGILEDLQADQQCLPDQDVLRVDETHAAVELVEFCVDDNAALRWKASCLGHRRMGATLFWHFVVPRMLALSDVAGCEYAYLFAAGERDGALVRYYREVLHFIEPKKLGAIKPCYDRQCVLMIKKLFTGKPGVPGPLGVMEPDPDYLVLDRHMANFFEKFNDPAVS